MQPAPIPAYESERLQALIGMKVLDTNPEERFDRITKHAAELLKVPIAVISLVDSDREWFKSCQGLSNKEGDRSISFCGHAMLSKFIFIVEDTLKDSRFADNPQVVGAPFVRFYAGVALHDRQSGLPVGVFCVKDIRPRQLTPEEVAMIIDFGNQAEEELNKNI